MFVLKTRELIRSTDSLKTYLNITHIDEQIEFGIKLAKVAM